MKHNRVPSGENWRKKSSATTCDRGVRKGNHDDDDDDDVAIGSASFQTGDRHPSFARRLIAQLSPPSACYIIGPTHSRSPRLDRPLARCLLFRSASLISILRMQPAKWRSVAIVMYRTGWYRSVATLFPTRQLLLYKRRQSADRCIRVA